MSDDYEVAVVPSPEWVSVGQSDRETVQLSDVMGKFPTPELVTVLGSGWARAQGWTPASDGPASWQRAFDGGVILGLTLGELGQVTLTRSVGAVVVLDSQAWETERAQDARLRDPAVVRACGLAINELVGRAVAASLRRVAIERGYTVLEERPLQNTTYGVELKLELTVRA